VTFESNTVRHGGAGVQILGFDDAHPSQQTRGITIRNNLFDDIDPQNWGGNGYFLQLVSGPRDIVVDHNTVIQDHAGGILFADGAPVLGFTFTNNLIRHGAYGIMGTNRAPGNDAIGAYLPASLINSNVIAEGDASRYPPGNQFPTLSVFTSQFIAYGADFRLVPASPWRHAGTDGSSLGSSTNETPPAIPPAPPEIPER